MSAYKSYVNISVLKLNDYNQAEVIPLYIENVVLITDTIYRIESSLYVSEISPSALACL